MPIDPESKALLDMLESVGFPDIAASEPVPLRAFLAAMGAAAPPGPDLPKVEDTTAGGVPVRVYTPDGPDGKAVIVYYHGGGWVVGNVAESDGYCRTLAQLTGAVVVSVEYRLAPEHRYPAAADDCWAATVWVAEHAAELGADASRLVVAGDSAGANLAAVVALRARDGNGPEIALQVLSHPVTDHDFDNGSYTENEAGPLLTRASMIWFWDHYAPDVADRDKVDASPAKAESLAGLPPAYVITSELDPLRDEGEAYAARLREAGVAVTSKRYDGQFHCFNTMGAALPKGHAALEEMAAAVKQAVA